MLLWSIEETAGFDSAWASIDGDRLRAEPLSCRLRPHPALGQLHHRDRWRLRHPPRGSPPGWTAQ